jgi:hypothetical protein
MPEKRLMWQTSFHFFTLVLILVFANWGAPAANDGSSLWYFIFTYKWYITGMFAIGLCYSLTKILKIKWLWVIGGAVATLVSAIVAKWFIPNPVFVPLVPMIVGIASLSLITLFDKQDDDNHAWTISAWGFAKQILPLLTIGIITAGFLLGSTHDTTAIAGIIPNRWIEWAVGGNSLISNFFASFTGAFMYFATLTEVPIIQGLLASGMGKGPALAFPVLILAEYARHSRRNGYAKNDCLCRSGNSNGHCVGDSLRNSFLIVDDCIKDCVLRIKRMLVLPKDDSVYGLVGFYFKLVLTAIFVYVVVYALFPTYNGCKCSSNR